MDKLIIEGGRPLSGVIDVNGSKNAALPILLSSILLEGPQDFFNVPNLRDIRTTLKLLNLVGCNCTQEGKRVHMEPGTLTPEAPYDLVRTMRASVLCLGPLIARLGKATVALPGGCAIGARPVDQHLKGLEKMGATFTLEGGNIIGRCDHLRGAQITFDMPTVGGTENLIMARKLPQQLRGKNQRPGYLHHRDRGCYKPEGFHLCHHAGPHRGGNLFGLRWHDRRKDRAHPLPSGRARVRDKRS